jgi:hypothetical protein
MTLEQRIAALATRVGNYLRDSVLTRLLPAGGAVAQYLVKTAAGDFAVGWATPPAAFNVISKPADTGRANMVALANDPDLAIVLAAGGKYRIRISAVFDVASQTDLKVATAFSGTTALVVTYRKSMIAAAVAGTDLFTESVAAGLLASTSLAGTGAGPVLVEIDTVIHVTNAGTFAFQWAQDTTGAQAATCRAGSVLEWLKVV